MAVDNRPFKSKEQDGQGNEVIIRDQQLVEQGTTTTMPAGACFQTLDVDGRPVKIPKDNMLNLIVEGLGIIFNGQSDQQTVTKVPTLNGNNFGASTVATLASVLGAALSIHVGKYLLESGETKELSASQARGLVIVTVYNYGIYGAVGIDATTATKIFGTYVNVDKDSHTAFVMYVEGGRYYIKNNFESSYTVALTVIKN